MKKLFTFITLLMAIVMGAQAETAVLYSDGTTANSVTINNFTIAITGNTEKNWSAGNGDVTIEGTAYKTLKNSNGAQNTITCPDGYVATNITFYAVANNDATPGKLSEIDGTKCDDEVTSLKDYSNPTVISKDIDNKSQFTFTFSTKQVCFAAVVTYKASAPVGPVDPVFSLVKSTIKAGETAQIQVGSKGNLDGIELNNVKYQTLNAIQSLDRQTGVITLVAGFTGTAKFTFDSNSVDNKYNYSENNELTLTVEAAAAAPAVPTFDKAAGSTIKVGEPIVITSDDGSQIYYNWSGKATGAYDAAKLLQRTPKDSPASCTTSTTGSRYLYALAKKGDGVSDIAIIGYTVEANPVKGQLDKTTDAVDQNAEAPALPVFTVVDANGNASTASIGYGEDTKKDVTVKYEVLASSTAGIVTLKADGSGIESISTATAGEATVSITLTSNKDGYPLVDGETGVYTYTVTVNGSAPSEPVDPIFSLVKSEITAGETAQIQVGDKGNLDGIELSEVTFNTLGAIESIDRQTGVIVPAAGFVGEASFTIKSSSVDGKYNASDEQTLTLTVKAAEPAGAPADPTFDVADGAEVEAGAPITITSDADATIYYRWSGSATKTWADKAAFIDGRTAYTGTATTSTSTVGDRYLYVKAYRGEYESAMVMLHIVVKQATGVDGIAEEAQAEGTVKVVKDGKIIIVTPNGQFNAAGAQVK